MNEGHIRFDFSGVFVDGDQMTFSWKGTDYADCNPVNFLGDIFTYENGYWPSIWFGYGSGAWGVSSYERDELHVCWKPIANQSPAAWIRVRKSTGGAYQVRVNEYDNPTNEQCPELLSFDPTYGAATLTEDDTEIKFNFLARDIYPSGNPLPGKIVIYRGAVKPDGSFVRMNDVLWEKLDLDDSGTNPFHQGDLTCTSGACKITLS
jgi:hypothetical protein